MPTYEYRCLECGSEFEHFQKMTDEPLKTLHAAQGLPNEYQTFGTTYQLGLSYAIY